MSNVLAANAIPKGLAFISVKLRLSTPENS